MSEFTEIILENWQNEKFENLGKFEKIIENKEFKISKHPRNKWLFQKLKFDLNLKILKNMFLRKVFHGIENVN